MAKCRFDYALFILPPAFLCLVLACYYDYVVIRYKSSKAFVLSTVLVVVLYHYCLPKHIEGRWYNHKLKYIIVITNLSVQIIVSKCKPTHTVLEVGFNPVTWRSKTWKVMILEFSTTRLIYK